MELDNSKKLELYRKMILVRTMEEKHESLVKQGEMDIYGHFSTGQEAVGIGVTSVLNKEDVMFGTHRGWYEYLGKGMDPKNIWAEYLGKKETLSGGRAGLGLNDKENNIPGTCACLGGNFGISVGMALAIQKQKEDRVVMSITGDGTMNQADAHPSLLMASCWKLPHVQIIVNNHFSEYSYWKEFVPTETIAERGAAYDIPYDVVDGQDVEAVAAAAAKAVDHAKSGKGPYILECRTYRIALHWQGDYGGYVDEDEKAEWLKRDPIVLYREKLINSGVLTESADAEIRKEISDQIEKDVAYAFGCTDPDEKDLLDKIFTTIEW